MVSKITLTFAQSLDGRIATSSGESRYISEEGSLKLNQEMRREHDAIVVGIGTVLADDPLLTCRIESEKTPLRVILDPSLRLPAEGKLAETAVEYTTIVFYDNEKINSDNHSFIDKIELLKSRNIILKAISSGSDGHLSLKELIGELDTLGVESIMVEGGSAVLTSFLRNDLWTDMIIVSAVKIIGDGIPSFGELGVRALSEVIKPVVKDITVIGNEVCWHLTNFQVCESVQSNTLYFTAPKTVELRTDVLENPGIGYTLFHSRIMAISPGTEKQYYRGNFEYNKKADSSIDCTDGLFTYPFSYGYINVVEDSSGDRYFGFLPHSEKVFASKKDLYRLDDSIDDESALFIPHMETAVSIIHDSKPKLGDRVLITGAGLIGTLIQRILSRIMGIEVIIFDINPEKKTWFKDDNFCSNKDELLEMSPFDICIDVSGAAEGLQTCIECSQAEGCITVGSWYGDQNIPINFDGFHWKRLRLISSQVSNLSPALGKGWNKSRRLKFAVDLLHKVKTEDLLTHRYSINDAAEAYKLIDGTTTLYGLIALLPGG